MLDRLPDPKPVTWVWTPEDRVQYAQEVIAELRARGSKHPTSIDWDILWGWMNRDVPLRVILGAIGRLNPGKRIPSLAYARRGIEGEIRDWLRLTSMGRSDE